MYAPLLRRVAGPPTRFVTRRTRACISNTELEAGRRGLMTSAVNRQSAAHYQSLNDSSANPIALCITSNTSLALRVEKNSLIDTRSRTLPGHAALAICRFPLLRLRVRMAKQRSANPVRRNSHQGILTQAFTHLRLGASAASPIHGEEAL